jgi:putative DNA primase/helicase
VSAATQTWMPGTAFERLTGALEAAGLKVTGIGRQRKAQCPHHADRDPSLSITDAESRVLLNCKAGCETDDVLADLGLARRDLFNEPAQKRGADDWASWQQDQCPCPPVARYPYTDEDGTLLYQHVRGTHKEFAFRRPDPASRSGWRWSLGDTRRVLYRLSEVVKAPPSAVIFVTEGESDTNALVAAGEIATTTDAGALTGTGAKRWRPEWSEALRGRDVLVTADRDQPGRVHARHVAASLDGIARSAWIVEAAAGKDARDHLAAGLAVTDLVWWS